MKNLKPVVITTAVALLIGDYATADPGRSVVEQTYHACFTSKLFQALVNGTWRGVSSFTSAFDNRFSHNRQPPPNKTESPQAWNGSNESRAFVAWRSPPASAAVQSSMTAGVEPTNMWALRGSGDADAKRPRHSRASQLVVLAEKDDAPPTVYAVSGDARILPAAALTSSSQLSEQTWLRVVKSHGNSYGLAAEAHAIHEHDGHYTVDPAERQALLSLRQNRTIADLMAAELNKENVQVLRQALGRTPSDEDLQIARSVGASEAVKLIEAKGTTNAQVTATSGVFKPDNSVSYGGL